MRFTHITKVPGIPTGHNTPVQCVQYIKTCSCGKHKDGTIWHCDAESVAELNGDVGVKNPKRRKTKNPVAEYHLRIVK